MNNSTESEYLFDEPISLAELFRRNARKITYADILPAVESECGKHPDCFARNADDCPYIDICRSVLTRDQFEAAVLDRWKQRLAE